LKHWGIKEFSILDPDNNLLTFGENGIWDTITLNLTTIFIYCTKPISEIR
jgi:hypothetical protein